jgi:hypothetical protein
MTDDLDLTPDPAAEGGGAGEVMPIEGILAEGSDPDSVRLYLDPAFETYYDIPRDAVVRRDRLPAERSSLGLDSSRLLVRRGTPLVAHRASTRPVEEEFLSGDFTAPGSFRAEPMLFARQPSKVAFIPTYTIYGHLCCHPPSNGCVGYKAVHDTQGNYPTGGGHCTLMTPCQC